MTLAEELRKGLDECGVKYTTDDGRFAKVTKWLALNGRLAVYAEYDSGEVRFAMDSLSLTPTQAIAVTVGNAYNLTDLWKEWERVLFANVRDEVAQDNLNECFHALLDKAATAGMGTCRNVSEYTNVFTCSECGYEYDFITDPYNGPSFCPNCGRRVEVSE